MAEMSLFAELPSLSLFFGGLFGLLSAGSASTFALIVFFGASYDGISRLFVCSRPGDPLIYASNSIAPTWKSLLNHDMHLENQKKNDPPLYLGLTLNRS